MHLRTLLSAILLGYASVTLGQTPEPTKPTYTLTLSRDEHAVLQAAAMGGVRKYGGSADYRVSLAKRGEELVWTLTTQEPKLMEAWEAWLSESIAEVVGATDFSSLDEGSRAGFDLLRVARTKLVEARKRPTWETSSFVGTIDERDGGLTLIGEEGTFRLTGEHAATLKGRAHQLMVVTGYHKARGELEALRAVERRPNVLELCVMSQCPFGIKAEQQIITKLRDARARASVADGPVPTLEVRYIVLKARDEERGTNVWWSLHGESEVNEDLVQIAIRESFASSRFEDYLLARTQSDAPWKDLASRIGFSAQEIAHLSRTIERDRDALLEREFQEVVLDRGVAERSPTFLWEGRATPDLHAVPALAGVELGSGSCGGR